MDKLQRYDESFVKPTWIENMGDFNSLPTPFVPCAVQEYCRIRRSYTPSFFDFRQVRLDDGPYQNIHLEFFHDVAFGLIHREDPIEPIKCYKIGCKHSYRQMNNDELQARGIRRFNCSHEMICTQCGQEWCYDSGD